MSENRTVEIAEKLLQLGGELFALIEPVAGFMAGAKNLLELRASQGDYFGDAIVCAQMMEKSVDELVRRLEALHALLEDLDRLGSEPGPKPSVN
jgi:hypothetical protein